MFPGIGGCIINLPKISTDTIPSFVLICPVEEEAPKRNAGAHTEPIVCIGTPGLWFRIVEDARSKGKNFIMGNQYILCTQPHFMGRINILFIYRMPGDWAHGISIRIPQFILIPLSPVNI